MANVKVTTAPASAQTPTSTKRPISKLDWNSPRKPRTPRGEYAFMRSYFSLICGTQPHRPDSFGRV